MYARRLPGTKRTTINNFNNTAKTKLKRMKRKIFTLLTLLLCVCSGAWGDPTYYKPEADEVIILSENMSGTGENAGKGTSTHVAFSFGAEITTVGSAKCGDPSNNGAATSSNVSCYPIKGNGGVKNLTVTISGCTKLIVYHNSHDKRYIKAELTPLVGDGSTQTGVVSTTYTEITLDAEKSYSIFIYGYDGSDKADLYAYALKLVAPSDKVATPKYSLGAWDAVNSLYAVTLSCATPDATIKYSTDNKASYSVYSAALTLAPGTTLDAYAEKEGLTDSNNMTQYTVPAAPYTVTFDKNGADGVAPTVIGNIVPGNTITLPKNFTMYKEGYTMIGWDIDDDGTADYEPGDSYTPTADITLKAVFASNGGTTLDDRTAETEILFDFRRDNGAPIVSWEYADATHYWIAQATVAGKTIDVPMTITTTAGGTGKFANTGNTDCTQVKDGTPMAIPSCNGATVEMECHASFTISTTTIDGSTSYTGTGTAKISYDVTSDNDPVDVVIGDGSYYKYIKVTLPTPEGGDLKADFKFTSKSDWSGTNQAPTQTISPITATYALTNDKQATYLKFVENNTLTVSATGAYIIKKIEMGYESGKEPASNNITVTTGGGTINSAGTQWDGCATSVVLTKGTGECRMNSLKVTYVEAEAVSTLAGRNYGSHVTSSALDFTEVTEAKAYVATGLNGGGTAVVLTQVYKVPANEPIIIYTTEKASAATVYVPKTNEAADAAVSDNELVAGDGSTAWNGTANTTYYYLASDLFHEATSGTLQSGKAYLAVASGSTPAPLLSISFGDEGETTGINAVKGAEFKVNGEYYNLAGQRVAQPTKGLYIVNGRKVVIK